MYIHTTLYNTATQGSSVYTTVIQYHQCCKFVLHCANRRSGLRACPTTLSGREGRNVGGVAWRGCGWALTHDTNVPSGQKVVSCPDAPPTGGEEHLVTLLNFLGPNLCA